MCCNCHFPLRALNVIQFGGFLRKSELTPDFLGENRMISVIQSWINQSFVNLKMFLEFYQNIQTGLIKGFLKIFYLIDKFFTSWFTVQYLINYGVRFNYAIKFSNWIKYILGFYEKQKLCEEKPIIFRKRNLQLVFFVLCRFIIES